MIGVEYFGRISGFEHQVFTVVRFGERCSTPRPLRHVVKHSPAGFAWGYGGSGPAELARCILIDALGMRAVCFTCRGSARVVYDVEVDNFVPAPNDANDLASGCCPDCWGSGVSNVVERNYQYFKRDVVASWPQDAEWVLPRDEVLAWCRENMAVPV